MKVVNIFPGDSVPKLGILLGEDESSFKIFFFNGDSSEQVVMVPKSSKLVAFITKDRYERLRNCISHIISVPTANYLEDRGFEFLEKDPDYIKVTSMLSGEAKEVDSFDEDDEVW